MSIKFRNLGKEANINKVHPHKFRRTMATMAIDKGMPIEQVQKLLGHYINFKLIWILSFKTKKMCLDFIDKY